MFVYDLSAFEIACDNLLVNAVKILSPLLGKSDDRHLIVSLTFLEKITLKKVAYFSCQYLTLGQVALVSVPPHEFARP